MMTRLRAGRSAVRISTCKISLDPLHASKKQRPETERSHSSSAEIKKKWMFTSTHPFSFTACAETNFPLEL